MGAKKTAALLAAALAACLVATGGSAGGRAVAAAAAFSGKTQAEAAKAPKTQKTAFDFTAVKMITSSAGWAENANHVCRTADGGKTWNEVTPAATTGPYDMSAGFLDAKTAAVAVSLKNGTTVKVYFTGDGGKTWKSASVFTDDFGGYTVRSLDITDDTHAFLMIQPDHGMNSEPGSLYVTSNSGASWSLVTSTYCMWDDDDGPPSTVGLPFGGSVRFQNMKNGFISGSFTTTTYDELYATRDGGQNWQKVKLPVPSGHPSGLFSAGVPALFGSKNGALTALFAPDGYQSDGFSSMIFVTHDGGADWQSVKEFEDRTVEADFAEKNVWWFWQYEPQSYGEPTEGSFVCTSDAGKTFRCVAPGKTLSPLFKAGQDVVSLDFLDKNTGYTVIASYDGTKSAIYKTVNGGQSWSIVYPK